MRAKQKKKRKKRKEKISVIIDHSAKGERVKRLVRKSLRERQGWRQLT